MAETFSELMERAEARLPVAPKDDIVGFGKAMQQEQRETAAQQFRNVATGIAAGTIGWLTDLANSVPGLQPAPDRLRMEISRSQLGTTGPREETRDAPAFSSNWFIDAIQGDPESIGYLIGELGVPDLSDLGKQGPAILGSIMAGWRGVKTSVGARGKVAREALKTAQTMKEAGNSPAEVFLNTGWWNDPFDSMWKFELPSWNARLDMDSVFTSVRNGDDFVSLGDFYDFEDLYEMYPALRDLPIRVDYLVKDDPRLSEGFSELFRGRNHPTKLDPNTSVAMTTHLEDFQTLLTHELNHVTQDIEGFGIGTTGDLPSNIADVNEVINKSTLEFVTRPGTPEEIVQNFKRRAQQIYQDAMNVEQEVLLYRIATISSNDEPIAGNALNKAMQHFETLGAEVAPDDVERIISEIYTQGRTFALRKIQYLQLQNEILGYSNTLFQNTLDKMGGETLEDFNKIRGAFYNVYRSTAGETNARLAERRLALAGNAKKHFLERKGTEIPDAKLNLAMRRFEPGRMRETLLRTEGISPDEVLPYNPVQDPIGQTVRRELMSQQKQREILRQISRDR